LSYPFNALSVFVVVDKAWVIQMIICFFQLYVPCLCLSLLTKHDGAVIDEGRSIANLMSKSHSIEETCTLFLVYRSG
nr:hypothetical protein [Tanacetum cinerariifolium]